MWLDKEIYDKDLEEEIRGRLRGRVDLQLGKKGITESFINELLNRLNKHRVVKIRVLKSFRTTYSSDMNQVANILSNATGSRIYEIRGFTIILIKEK